MRGWSLKIGIETLSEVADSKHADHIFIRVTTGGRYKIDL